MGSPSGAWLSGDGGHVWRRAEQLPATHAWQVASASEAGKVKVFISVVKDPYDAGLYSSPDLIQWTRELNGVFRLSESSNDAYVLALDESQPDHAQVLGVAEPKPIDVTSLTDAAQEDFVLRAAGGFDMKSTILAESPTGVYASADGGTTWHRTLEGRLASLAAATDFESTGVALAGGYRQGISRTTDGGASWTRVLVDPSLIVPCSGIISSMVFLDGQAALAVSSPTLVWVKR